MHIKATGQDVTGGSVCSLNQAAYSDHHCQFSSSQPVEMPKYLNDSVIRFHKHSFIQLEQTVTNHSKSFKCAKMLQQKSGPKKIYKHPPSLQRSGPLSPLDLFATTLGSIGALSGLCLGSEVPKVILRQQEEAKRQCGTCAMPCSNAVDNVDRKN